MKKEEFPTFLNEQPTVIFGRTGRELLIIVCGIVGAYSVWANMKDAVGGVGGQVLSGFLAAVIVIIALVIALTNIASRPLEEWIVVWLTYVVMPRVYMYQQPEEEIDEDLTNEKNDSQRSDDADALEED
ncbi:hypothetical protein KSF_037010 [Reticulibacter mediterranei]|uniref:PrgI family protein n=1 Tax=Reticulibacter mediterranei TaxID=2778369 RepID=A0A8J3N2S3_9CHLR|nr:PrgI family protein [Reticulibacter mediterranei]GHO93653.1 hypothetical protein KSF_037010 [Reticulibacter mediterranei]